MIEIITDTSPLETVLNLLTEKELTAINRRAAKRAASHAKVIGSKGVRSKYTIKSARIKRAIKLTTTGGGAEILISSSRLPVEEYKARQRKKGVFVSIRKGSGGIAARSFSWSNTFWQRDEGVPRYPIRRIVGPAVPQLFEYSDEVLQKMSQEALDKYEERFIHELGRIL